MAEGTNGRRCGYFNCDRVKPTVVYTWTESVILFLHKKEGDGGGNVERLMKPCQSALAIYASIALVSAKESGQTRA